MPQKILVLREEDVNRGSLLYRLQIYDFGYMLHYFVVFYFWFLGLTQANQLSLLR